MHSLISYRAQAERIAEGASGVRLDVPAGPPDEINRLGATLNAMLDAQERAATRQQQFIDDASHELRTPLSTICAEIDLALRKPRSAAQYEQALQRLAASSSRLVELAQRLLTLGALGSTTPQAADVGAPEVLEAAARRARGPDHGLGLRTVYVRCRPELVIHADRTLVELALGNLVDNAIAYGGPTITLTGAIASAPSLSCAMLCVHDDGTDMPPGFLPHAAERFRQHDSARAGRGAGLGLALVDAIATAHRGQLRICSAGHHHQQPTAHDELRHVACDHPDAGTTVTLLLPHFAP